MAKKTTPPPPPPPPPDQDNQPQRIRQPRTRAAIRQTAARSDGIALQACTAALDRHTRPKDAAQAFRNAMPPMQAVSVSGLAQIAATGMARRALTGKEASTLLYAAQVSRAKP